MLLTSRLMLISPSEIVTGSISTSTRLTSGLRQSKTNFIRKGVLRMSQTSRASCSAVPTRTPTA